MTKRKKWYRRGLLAALLVNMIVIGIFAYQSFLNRIPNDLRIVVNESEEIDFSFLANGIYGDILPMGEKEALPAGALSVNNKKLDKDSLRLDFKEPFSVEASQTGDFKISVKLFGFIELKEVNLNVIEKQRLIPCGFPIGIHIKTNGILVLGTGVITGGDGLNYEPALNILRTGDYILKVNGINIENKQQLMDEIEDCSEAKVILTIRRDEEIMDVSLEPVKDASGSLKIGAWIREDTQGIGTLTYIGEDGSFGALGHGITDIDTGLLMNIREGGIYKAEILNIIKGQAGTPGEIVGVIDKTETDKFGNVEKNTKQGVFGNISGGLPDKIFGESLPIGLRQDTRIGEASILCLVDDQIQSYDIEIEEIEWNTKSESKGMVLHIVDEKLLNKTNGIIQGMSGSPIIQDGKIIGAVTHVFVRDSTRGYGIFIENMLKASTYQ